jgi:hypothetical protein
MLNDALRYLAMGWSVMPLRPRSKEPLLSSWTKYQTERASVTEATAWFAQTPDANLAIITGAVSGLGIVDVDGEEGFTTLARLGLRSPVVSLTGKGRQLFFRHPGTKLSNAVRTLPGIDIRGDGGYVVAPPSVHPNGKRYTWLGGVGGVLNLPSFPTGLFVSPASSGTTPNIAKPVGWIGTALKSLGEGNRNDTFASVVGRLHRDRWTPDDIRAVLLPHAVRVQFPESELDTVIWSITRKPVVITGKPVSPAGNGQPVAKLVLRTFDRDLGEYWKRQSGNRKLEFRTGYKRFDAITTGLQRGELLVVGARTETGKTNLLLGCAYGLCSQSKRVLLLSTEMAFDRIWDRYLALGGDAQSHPLIVCDDFATDINRIRDAIVESKADVFIFDHINVVGDDNETISRFLKGLKELAREFNMPGVVSAQLNRGAEWKDQEGQRVEPELRHLKGSGTIEETAAQVLLLNEKSDDPERKCIQGIVAKNRYGEKGMVDFVLMKKPYRMEEM